MTTKKRNKAERSQDRVRITFKELKQVSDSPSNGAERYRQPLQYVCRALTRKNKFPRFNGHRPVLKLHNFRKRKHVKLAVFFNETHDNLDSVDFQQQ